MTKFLARSTTLLVMLSVAFSITNRVALAAAECTWNGREVSCEEMGRQLKRFLGLGVGLFAATLILGTCATIFWILMIVHATSHEIENKAMWIILMVFTGVIGAFVYYFVVKRKFDK